MAIKQGLKGIMHQEAGETAAINGFTIRLLAWNKHVNTRIMPWKGELDPYRIWLSEIILQQTRVEQGWKYYESFIHNYPTVQDLAQAPDDAVFKLWEGLGYYSRCRNLLATARIIVQDYNGKFPQTYIELLKLKGVGPYTAAAIASFAFNQPHAVIDGNVYRVLARMTGNDTPIDLPAGKQFFTTLANELLSKKTPGLWNQAIMDFGAVVCTPQQPLCSDCTMNNICVAYQTGTTQLLPVKSKKLIKRKRFLHYLAAKWKGQYYIRKRFANDIWKDLYEFPILETTELADSTMLWRDAIGNQATFKWISPTTLETKQQLTHQTIVIQLLVAEFTTKPTWLQEYSLVSTKALKEFAFPVILKKWIDAGAFE